MGRRSVISAIAILAVVLLATLLPTLGNSSQGKVLGRVLNLALVERELPDYHMLEGQGNMILSTENITADLQATAAKLGLTLMVPEEIQEKANRDGDFLCLKFSQVEIGLLRASISLDNIWVRSQDSTQGYLSGGGMKLTFYNLLGRWLLSPMKTMWVS